SDVSLLDDGIVERLATFAAAVARALAPLHDEPPVYTPINEVGFIAWMASSSNTLWPYRTDECAGNTDVVGYAIKCRLVRAALAAMAAMREVDPRCRFMHVEPLVHVVAPREMRELAPLARQACSHQWQVLDLLSGRLPPELGGHPA